MRSKKQGRIGAAKPGWHLLGIAALVALVWVWGCVQNVPVDFKVTETLPEEIAVEYLQSIPFKYGYDSCCSFSADGIQTPDGRQTAYGELKYWVEHIGKNFMVFVTTPRKNTIFSLAAQDGVVPDELKKVLTALESLGIKNKNPVL